MKSADKKRSPGPSVLWWGMSRHPPCQKSDKCDGFTLVRLTNQSPEWLRHCALCKAWRCQPVRCSLPVGIQCDQRLWAFKMTTKMKPKLMSSAFNFDSKQQTTQMPHLQMSLNRAHSHRQRHNDNAVSCRWYFAFKLVMRFKR